MLDRVWERRVCRSNAINESALIPRVHPVPGPGGPCPFRNPSPWLLVALSVEFIRVLPRAGSTTLFHMADRPRLIVLAEPHQAALIRETVACAEVELVGATASSAANLARLCEALDVEPVTDLRQALQQDACDVIWLAAAQRLQQSEREFIRQQDIPAISTEPHPTPGSPEAPNPGENATALQFVPLMRRSPGFLAARSLLDVFGPAESVNIVMSSSEGQGTLFARLFDAVDVVQTLLGECESIDAALTGPLPAAPETLLGLHGHLTANIRCTNDRSAALALSNVAGRWRRSITLYARNACLVITDGGFRWTDGSGEIVDESKSAGNLRASALIAAHLRRFLDRVDTSEPPSDDATLLALCEAARLSCRTEASETPGRMIEMMRRP